MLNIDIEDYELTMQDGAEQRSQGGRRGSRRGNSAPTIADVASEARCSPMTVSRVINGEGNVREETRDRVREAIRKLNYSPNRAARSLAGGEQLRVALLFYNPSASYLSEFLMGALEEASRGDIQLVVHGCETMAEAEPLVHRLTKTGIRGFILPAPLCDDQSLLDLITELGAMAVAVGQGRATGAQTSVVIDEYQAAYDMTRHIIDLGHERIGFIIGNAAHVASGRRLEGFRAAMADAGLEVRPELVVQGRFTYRSGMAATERLLALDPLPTAIFASNDDMAAAAVAVAHREHLDVPNDITVCGFDDTAMASTIWPELTTVRQPIREMTAHALTAISRALRSKKSGGNAPTQIETLPYELIRRHSDAAPSLAGRRRKKAS